CATWFSEVEASLPTIVLVAYDRQGRHRADARVRLDGELLVERLDGRATAVDPGEHTFVFELPDGTSHDVRVVVLEGQKNVVIEGRFSTTQAPGRQDGATAPPPDANEPRAERKHDLLPPVFAGVALVAFG